MHPVLQVAFIIIVLALTLILLRYLLSWQVQRAKQSIVNELQEADAYSADKAIMLNYDKPFWQRYGLRDYRPFVLNAMVRAGQVIQIADGRYYLVREKLQ